MADFAHRGPLGLKATKPTNGTRAGLRHMRKVKALPCVICLRPGPSDAHHVFCGRYGSAKASDFETIPLCKACHQGPEGIHAQKATWEAINGPDYEFLPVVADMLAGQWVKP